MSDSDPRATPTPAAPRGDDPAPASIDLNADLGEGCPNDRALLRLVSSASISCGAHAGDEATIRETLHAAREARTVIGAHPGFADREGFGRREREATAGEVEALIVEQTEFLWELAREQGLDLRFLKPHGALYNQAQRDHEVARGVVAAAVRLGLPLLGQPGTRLAEIARERGVAYIPEGFPDRGYRDDGSLAPRGEPGAILDDPAEIAIQAVRLAASGRVRTLCIHGDEPGAVANAEVVRESLERAGIEIRGITG
ncbi:LamB/YcsF family protein [Aquisphaera giovannonii]|uniref:LamB/YcsF family protein n=1 Tax=Aquisphaera giovannonii TaxID=406548 RepID=A0A5B9VWE2_9BACT|nr:5-oxoprolinase subunit PxpA [Aquisphaera giovannonii]QEH32776.1 LamB/YcsF family protein [Aquisphaera giovannonii]